MASLTSILGDLPSSGNPYEYLEYRVARLILPELVPGAQALWMIDIGILVVVICLAFAFLAGRILHRDMYLYKKHRTGTGFVITPNSTVLFAFFATSFAIWTIPYVWCTSQAQKATTLRANDLRIQTGMLIPIFPSLALAFLTELQAMCNLVYIAACSSSRRPFITRIPAWAFNGAFGLFYFALAGAVLGLFTAGEIHWVKIIDAAEDLSDSLKIAAGDWRQGDSVDLSYLLTLTPMVETLEERAESAISIFNASYAVLLAYVVFIMVFYIPTGLSYLALLRRGLGKAGRPTSSNRPHDSAQAPSSSLSHLIILKTALIFFCGVCASVSLAFVAVDYAGVTSNGRKFSVINNLSFFTFSLMACLVMALLTFVTWQEELWSLFQRGKQGRSYGLSALDISIAIETVIMEDVDRSSVDSIPAFKVPLQQLPQPKNIDDSLRTKAAMGVDWAE